MANNERKYTAENLRPRLRDFLEKTNTTEIDDLMDYVESDLPNVLQNHFGVECSSVYEVRNHNVLLNARLKTQTDPVLRKINAASGNRLSQALKKYAAFLETKYFQETFAKPKKSKIVTPPPAPKPQPRELTEGTKKHVEAERAWRNPQLRAQCLDYYGYQCQCCGIRFEKVYGETGRLFIEVHHLCPISSYDGEHSVNPLQDLVPLCSNCHSMIHHLNDDEMTLKRLREIYTGPTWDIARKMEG